MLLHCIGWPSPRALSGLRFVMEHRRSAIGVGHDGLNHDWSSSFIDSQLAGVGFTNAPILPE